MYKEMQDTASVSPARYAGESSPVDAKPLTMDVLDRLRGMRDTAYETRSRLGDLRDRLFGYPPPSPTSTGEQAGNKLTQDTFASSFDYLANEVAVTLRQIDQLSLELGARL